MSIEEDIMPNKKRGMQVVYGIGKLLRIMNSIMMGLAVIIGIFIASKGESLLEKYPLGFAVGFLLTAGTMSINDYFDREIDAVNAPDRPIPSGILKPIDALLVGIPLVLLGVTVSVFLNLAAFLIAIFSVILMIYYNIKGKYTGFPGNLIVSICVSLPFIFGGTVANSLSGALLTFSLMAFLANTGREVTKGIADIEGDKKKNVKTLAVIYGPKFAAKIAIFFYFTAVIISPFPLLMGWLSPLYGILVSVTDIGLIYSSIRLFLHVSSIKARSVKSEILIWMAIGLVSFLIGAI
jgi:geranylgeranylglycerol-phosphate geranylgeranyltransferase